MTSHVSHMTVSTLSGSQKFTPEITYQYQAGGAELRKRSECVCMNDALSHQHSSAAKSSIPLQSGAAAKDGAIQEFCYPDLVNR